MGNFLGTMDSAVVVYRGIVNNGISGQISFAELDNGDIHISGRLTGLIPGGEYTLCVNRYGDLRSKNFNTIDITDGLFKITADESGISIISIYTDKFVINQIVGRSLIIIDFNNTYLACEIIGITDSIN